MKKNQEKNIVICGAYGFGNIGDEAILGSIVASIRASYPACKITVLSRKPKEDIKIKGVDKAYHSLNLFSVFSAIKEADIFVSGGGSLIQDVTSTRSLMYYLYTFKLAKHFGCKVMMYGSGIGPVINPKNRVRTAKVLNHCVDSISLRDEKSQDELAKLGVTRPEIQVAADPAVSHPVASDREVKRILSSVGIKNEEYYVVTLRNWQDVESKLDDFAKVADYIFDEYNLVPLFLPIDCVGDCEVEKLVADRMQNRHAIITNPIRPELGLGIIKNAEAILSVRLHALIFAATVGTPMAAVSYDPKVSAFMDYLMVDNIIEYKDVNFDNLKKIIDKSLTIKRKDIEKKAEKLKKIEKKNIEKFEEIFEGKDDGRIKLAFFQSDFNVGGIQKALLRLLKNLDYSRYSADVYYYDSNIFFELPKNDHLRFIKLERYPYWCRFVFFELLRKYTKQDFLDKEYDVAIDFNSYQNDCAVGATTINAKKRVMWIHNDVEIKLANEPKYKILKFFFGTKYKYYDEFVAVSEGIVDSFRRVTKTTKPIRVIQNYINAEEIISMSQEDPSVVVKYRGYKLCSVGRLCHQKGYDILLNEFAKVLEQRKTINLYLIGDGPDKEQLMQQAKDLGIEDHVFFLGNQVNPFAIMTQMDGFVLTSRYEGQGMVILEAKVLGLNLFISKNLEKYNPGIEGTEDLIEALIKVKKKERTIDMLKSYNGNVTRALNKLFTSPKTEEPEEVKEELPKMDLPKIEIPKIELPKLELKKEEQKEIKIFGFPIDNVSIEEATNNFEKLVKEDGLSIVVTANPEILNNASQNLKLAKLVYFADMVVPDGMSLVLVSKLRGSAFKERVAGIDFAYSVLKRSAKLGKKVFLLGGNPGVAEKAKENLEKEIKGLKIVGTNDGYFAKEDDAKIVKKINESGAEVLFVAMGSPRQEFFLSDNKNKLNAKFGVGIGGSLDVWSGNVNRAPQKYIDHNMEWLYRLKTQPERLGRMIKIPGFIVKALFYKQDE